MKLILFILLCTFKLNMSQASSCWSSPIAEKYKAEVQDLQEKLRETYADLNQRQTSTQGLIKSVIIEVKTENNNRIKTLKKVLSNTKFTKIRYNNCAYQQGIEVTKIYNKNNAMECIPNQNDMNELYTIKSNILKLEKVTSVLINFCQYLNPLERESTYLNMCITSKIRHIHLQIPIIELEFKSQLTILVNSVKKCANEEGNNIERNLNLISSNLHRCNLV